MLSDKINQDLKSSMLSGDKQRVEVLKGMKTAIQYATVASSSQELTEAEITAVLQKEHKKRIDAKKLYLDAGDHQRADKEDYESNVIGEYLPKMLDESEIEKLVDNAIGELGSDQKNMGQIIGRVKQESKGAADGSVIAAIVKRKLI